MRWLLAPGLLVVLGTGCSGSGSGGGTGATGAGGGTGATGAGGGAGAAEAGGGAGNGGAAGDAGPDAPGCATLCGSTCADLQNDPSNCGSCGHVCAANETCVAGQCTCTAAGQLDCGGGCIDVTSDPSHCGDCNTACNPGETCVAGSCTCASGLVCGGKCIAANDPLNCGGCGIKCGPIQSCTSGACACPGGWTMCGTTCFDLTSDTSHCGSCTNACNPGEVCSSSTCGCVGTSDLWCASANNCVNTSSDNNNCGACDVVCPKNSTCTSGTCVCNYNESFCGQTCVDLDYDAKNCGTCGHVCPGNELCGNGVCYCPAPAVGTSVRLTTSSLLDCEVSAAWDGTHVGVVYNDGAGLNFALLNPDGTRANATDTALPPSSPGLPHVTWNGSEYAVVASDGSNEHFIRVSAAGALLGSVIVGGGAGVPSIAWSSPYGGYAVTYEDASNQVGFRRIGADASAPDTPVPVTVGNATTSALAAAPDGTWQFIANAIPSGAFGMSIVQIAADGSTIAAQGTIPESYPVNRSAPAITYDGSAFLTAWISDSPTASMVKVTRDTTSPYTLVSTPNPNSADHNINAVALAPGATSPVTMAVGWTQRSGSGTYDPYTFQLQRFKVPPAAGQLTQLTTKIGVVPLNYIPATDQPIALVSTGTYSLLAVWADNRWGGVDLYAAPVYLLTCP